MSGQKMSNIHKVDKGSILLAEPFMLDPNFRRAVILITEHTIDDGSIGFVLNKPIKMKINDLIQDFPEIDSRVYIGGPVANETLHYIHDVGDILDDSIEISKGIYWSGDFEKLKFLIKSELIQPHNIRFFLGYSGWSSGQLMDELEYGSWVIAEMDPNYILKKRSRRLWNFVMKNKGGQFTVIAEMPDSLMLN